MRTELINDFLNGSSVNQIGNALGVTGSSVSQGIKTAVKKQCDPEVDEMVQRLIDLRVAVADYSVTVADQQRTEMNPETEYKVENITAIVKTILPELEQLKQVDDIERDNNTANKRKNAQTSSSDDKETHQMEVEAN